jgi:hypothetical protein
MKSDEKASNLAPVRDVGAEQGFNLLAVSRVPVDHKKRAQLARVVTDHIFSIVDSRLSPEDQELWRKALSGNAAGEMDWPTATKKRIFGALDRIIIQRAQTLGWRVYLSPWVLVRMAEWHHSHEHGPFYLNQLGKAVALAAGVARGEAKLPVSEPEQKQNKKQGVNELRRLFKKRQDYFKHGQKRSATYQDACEWFKETIEDSPKSFPFITMNLVSLLRYFEYARKEDLGFAARLASGEFNPAAFFDSWGAWGQGLSPETFRQSIARLPNKKS